MKRILVLLASVLLALPALAEPHSVQVTIGAGTNTVLSSANVYVSMVTIQNNTSDTMYVGGPEITSSKGIKLAAGASFYYKVDLSGQNPINLAQWYVAGTSSDVVDVTYDKVNY